MTSHLLFLNDFAFLSPILSVLAGIGLAAATGFRVFLPIFAVSLASYLGWIPLAESFQWLSGLATLIVTGVASLVELLAYYIPYIDHLLDTLSIPLASIAGTLIFASQFADMSAIPQWVLAIIAGGGTAAVISSGFAGSRALSTATTGGLGNNVVATTETAGAGVMSILALAAPVIAALMAIVLLVVFGFLGKKFYKKIIKPKEKPL